MTNVTQRILYFCIGGELHQQQVETMPYITLALFKFMKHLEIQVLQLKDLFVRFDLCHKVIVYVKDEGANLNTLINTLTNIVHVG